MAWAMKVPPNLVVDPTSYTVTDSTGGTFVEFPSIYSTFFNFSQDYVVYITWSHGGGECTDATVANGMPILPYTYFPIDIPITGFKMVCDTGESADVRYVGGRYTR